MSKTGQNLLIISTNYIKTIKATTLFVVFLFVHSWEQRKLSDMCSIITKQTGFDYSETIKPSLITEPREDTYSFIQNKDFDGENINFDTDFYIPISIANKYPRITLDCPSLLISISGKIGNVGYYNYLKKSFIGGAVGICKLLRANGSIIVYALQSNAGQRYFHSLIKASSHANITVQDIRNINVMLPRNEAEEIKVSQLLRSIDNLITLHQREVFSKNIIFKNIKFGGLGTENNTWEQRKLGEVAFYRRGSFPQPYGKKEWYDGNGAMSFVQVADVTDEMNLVENTKQKISTLAQPMSVYADKNSVLVTLQGSIGRVAITQYGAFIDRTVLIFEKYKEPINILFWAYIIKQKFIEEAHKAPGGTIKTITKEALSDFDLLLPKYDEQSRVGTFFKQLDNLITLHQRIKIFITGDYHDKKNK